VAKEASSLSNELQGKANAVPPPVGAGNDLLADAVVTAQLHRYGTCVFEVCAVFDWLKKSC